MLGLNGMRRLLPAAAKQRDFALFVGIVLSMNLASQMIAVAIGWQVYDVHHRAFDLGLIGLVEFVPVLALAIPGGQLADRVSRRLVLALALILLGAISGGLIAVSGAGARTLWPFLVLAGATGVATSLSFPVSRALPPMLVEPDLVASAIAIRSFVNQTTMVAGPALGGLLFAVRPELVYTVALALFVAALLALAAMRTRQAADALTGDAPQLRALLGGIHFIRATPVLLGAITLDLFAVLFGGAVALLPVFAQTVLHTGPTGLGILRSAPAAGAVIAGVWFVRRPLPRRTGPLLIACVTGFGASMIIFGLSRSFALSLVALALSGAFDMVSVNVRSTAVTLATPDRLRGRVGSVEAVFIGASNQLGAFESGSAAALLGAVPAVVWGGVATIVIAFASVRVFPSLARLDRMQDLRPEAVEPGG